MLLNEFYVRKRYVALSIAADRIHNNPVIAFVFIGIKDNQAWPWGKVLWEKEQ